MIGMISGLCLELRGLNSHELIELKGGIIMFENRWYKVSPNDGGTFITADFFNPITGEEKNLCIRDYDYADCSRDNDELYDPVPSYEYCAFMASPT